MIALMTAVVLPETFPIGTLFLVIEGVPVTESPDGEMLRWDLAEPLPLVARKLGGHAIPVSEATFRSIVQAY